MNDAENKVLSVYTKVVEVYNTIQEINKLNDKYFETNWTVGMSNISYDIEHMLKILVEEGFSFDYKQANTFILYLRLFQYLLKEMADELVVYEEGMNTIKFVQRNLLSTSEPFIAFVCGRVRDLDLLDKISPAIRKVYHLYENSIDELKEIDMSSIFEMALIDKEDFKDDEVELQLDFQAKKLFGEQYSSEDIQRLNQVMTKFVEKKEEEDSIELEF